MKLKILFTNYAKFIIHLLGNIVVKPFLILKRRRALSNIPENPKILYVSLAFRGDLILTFPAIRALKRRFPKSSITLWVREFNISLTELTSDIDKVETYDKFNLHALGVLKEYYPRNLHQGFINKIKRSGYDIYIDDSGYTFTALVGSLSKIPLRIGRNQQGFGYLYHYDFPYDFDGHLIKKKYTLLKPFEISGQSESDYTPQIIIPEEIIRVAKMKSGFDYLNTRYFTCFPRAGWAAKNWDIDRFLSVAVDFSSYSGLVPVFLGGDKDIEISDYIDKNITVPYHSLIGKLNMAESAAIISKAALHFGVDSVGSHLAAASDVKSLTIFGPTNPRLIACLTEKNIAILKKTNCTPAHNKIYCCWDAGRSCPNVSCMRELEKDDVLATLKALWDGKIKSKVVEL